VSDNPLPYCSPGELLRSCPVEQAPRQAARRALDFESASASGSVATEEALAAESLPDIGPWFASWDGAASSPITQDLWTGDPELPGELEETW
jgi:hypothetical protein